jgi:CxxC motif-containing protein (DUF1111 family)
MSFSIRSGAVTTSMIASGQESRLRAEAARFRAASIAGAAFLLAACSGGTTSPEGPTPQKPLSQVHDVPISNLTAKQDADFNDGDAAFAIAMRDADGLGPLYTRVSCDACHTGGVRGPGLVQKMSVVDADRVTPAADQSVLRFGHTVHPLLAGGGVTPIVPPPDDSSVLVTTRVGPPILGRGYMEAILDSEIQRVADEEAARTDQIHGRINHVVYASEMSADESFHTHVKGDAVLGRFGLKARIATLDDFTADAFQGDMGITSPLRPVEFANPDGLLDDAKPGIDVQLESVKSRAIYLRLLSIPARRDDPDGAALFADTLCAACHVPSMHTRADYPVAQIADKDAAVYTDLLLHDMGPDLADGLPADPSVDYEASSLAWRTAPLIGLRFNRTYMHDGRGKTVEEAIGQHRGDGSEANDAIDRFDALSTADRRTLIDFVEGL